jgi:tetratricopeptide (TPR) repeat protein
VLLRLGRAAEAAAALAQARDVYRAAHDEPNPDVAYADNELAQALRALGRGTDAARALDDAETVEKGVPDPPPAVVAATLAMQAHLALDRDDVARAIVLGERALGAAKVDETQPSDLADARLVLATALHRQSANPPRVRRLAEEARDGFGRIHDEAHVEEAQALVRSLEP